MRAAGYQRVTSRIRCNCAILIAVAVISSSALASNPLFACRVSEAAAVLASNEESQRLRSALDIGPSFTLDTLSGVVRWTFAVDDPRRLHFPAYSSRYEIWQRGDADNDWIALRMVRGLASNPIDIVRIRTRDGNPRFSWLDGQGQIFGGICIER